MLETQFGFRQGHSTHEAIILTSRMMEDAALYGSAAGIGRFHATFFDLRKAFPSLNWHLVQSLARASGIAGCAKWSFLESAQRLSDYTFKKGTETIVVNTANGVKEGDVSSPTIFVWTYCSLMKEFKAMRNDTPRKGISLISRTDVLPANRTVDLAKLLWPNAGDTAAFEQFLSEVVFE